jgi:hypothetical protein
MTRLLVAGFAVWAVSSVGCATCRYHACEPALRHEPCEDDPILPKHKTYAVLVNGGDVLGIGKFAKMQHRLNEAGFAMAYYGQVFHGGMIERELRDVFCRDADTRFVIVGYGEGTAVAESLAGRLTAGGLPVDAVVHLAPVRTSVSVSSPPSVKRLVFYPEGATTIGSVPDADGTVLPGVGHYDVPSHPVVVSAVLNLMRESAGRVPVSDATQTYLPILDDPAPIPNIIVESAPTETTPLTPPRKKQPTADLTGRVK